MVVVIVVGSVVGLIAGCCCYGWFDICVLVVVVMDGLISVFWLL